MRDTVDALELIRPHFERLFPMTCAYCGRRFVERAAATPRPPRL